MNSETYLIATLMAFPETVPDVSSIVKPDDFEDSKLGDTYAGIQSVYAKNQNFDIAILVNEFEGAGRLRTIGGNQALFELATIAPASGILAVEHAQAVFRASSRRRVVKGLAQALEAAKIQENALSDMAGMIEKIALEASETRQDKDLAPLSSFLPQVWKVWEAQARGEITGLRTGFRDIDEHTSGLQKTDFVVIGGRPGMGKTSFALEIMSNVCRRGGVGAFFELEMTSWQVVARAIFQKAKVNSQVLKRGSLPQREFLRLKEVSELIRNDKFFFDDTTGLTPLQALSKCRKLKSKHGLDLVVIDNVQIMKGDGNYRGNRRQELADVSNSLKRLAKSIEAPVIGISHLNRESAKSSNPVPSLHDLKETGDLEQDADIVMLLHNPSHYGNVEDGKDNVMQIIFAKFREGQIGTKEMQFQPAFTCFEDYSDRKEEPPQPYYQRNGVAF